MGTPLQLPTDYSHLTRRASRVTGEEYSGVETAEQAAQSGQLTNNETLKKPPRLRVIRPRRVDVLI